MEKQTTNQLAYWTGVIMASLFIGFLIQFARAWTEPGANPPGGNLGAPVNTGALGQIKAGTLGINSDAWVVGTPVGVNTGLTVGGKAQADDFCLNSDNTKCLSGGTGGKCGGYTFYIDGHSDKLMYGMGAVSGNTFSGTTYCDPNTVDYSCGYASNVHCPWGPYYPDREECTFYLGAVYMPGGQYHYQVDVEGLEVNTVTEIW